MPNRPGLIPIVQAPLPSDRVGVPAVGADLVRGASGGLWWWSVVVVGGGRGPDARVAPVSRRAFPRSCCRAAWELTAHGMGEASFAAAQSFLVALARCCRSFESDQSCSSKVTTPGRLAV